MLNISSGEDETDNMELGYTIGMKESAQLTVIALQSCWCLGQQAQDDPRSAYVRISHTVVSLSSSKAFDERLSPTTPVQSILVDNNGKWKRGWKKRNPRQKNIRRTIRNHHAKYQYEMEESKSINWTRGLDTTQMMRFTKEITKILTIVFD